MKKIVFGIMIAAIAASPAMAAKKAKKAKAPAVVATTTANSNQNSLNFAKDSLPIFLPTWTMPAYMAVQNQK